jgi:hypothetical protein
LEVGKKKQESIVQTGPDFKKDLKTYIEEIKFLIRDKMKENEKVFFKLDPVNITVDVSTVLPFTDDYIKKYVRCDFEEIDEYPKRFEKMNFYLEDYQYNTHFLIMFEIILNNGEKMINEIKSSRDEENEEDQELYHDFNEARKCIENYKNEIKKIVNVKNQELGIYSEDKNSNYYKNIMDTFKDNIRNEFGKYIVDFFSKFEGISDLEYDLTNDELDQEYELFTDRIKQKMKKKVNKKIEKSIFFKQILCEINNYYNNYKENCERDISGFKNSTILKIYLSLSISFKFRIYINKLLNSEIIRCLRGEFFVRIQESGFRIQNVGRDCLFIFGDLLSS